MISKEEFNKVFSATSREGILNQFYYEHIELIKLQDRIDKAIEYIKTHYLKPNEPELLNILQGSDEE